MQADEIETGKLLREYTALAPTYAQRWSGYLRASLGMTMQFVTDLPAARALDMACGTGQLLDMLTGHEDEPELFGID